MVGCPRFVLFDVSGGEVVTVGGTEGTPVRERRDADLAPKWWRRLAAEPIPERSATRSTDSEVVSRRFCARSRR